jgi:hypothetical protein
VKLVCVYSPSLEHEGSESLWEVCLEYVEAIDEPCPGMGLGPSRVGQPNTHSTRPDLCVWCLEYDLLLVQESAS